MNVNTCYPVRHPLLLLAGAESVPSVTLSRVAGYRCSHRGRQRRPIIPSTRTLRIRQLYGLDFSTVGSISPLQATPIVTRTHFHELSRAAGPTRPLCSNLICVHFREAVPNPA